jgi:hypothetical protein
MFWGKQHAFLPTVVQSSIPQLERMTSLLLIQGRHMLIDIPMSCLTGGRGFRRTKKSAERVKTRGEEA